MLFPYQIGDVPLFRYLVGADDPIQFSFESEWDIPVVRFNQSGKSLYQGPSNRSLNQPTTVSIEGIVQAKSAALAQELLSQLHSMGGRLAIPLIVFRYEDPLEGGDASELDWLVADAIITSKPQSLAYSGMDLSEAGHVRLRLDIELTLMNPFQRLYAWFWEYRAFQNRLQNAFVADGAASASLSFIHPRLFSEINDQYYFVRWLDPVTLSDPDFWEIAHINSGQGQEFEEIYEIFYHSDPMRWSSAPQIVYAFTNLLPYGSLRIDVQRSTGNFYNQDYIESSTIDLVQLDSDLAAEGYGGLINSDILYVGDVFPFPSYILRNNDVLAGVTPLWDYDGLFPGELQTGAGRVRFIPNLSSMLVAYSFAYGML